MHTPCDTPPPPAAPAATDEPLPPDLSAALDRIERLGGACLAMEREYADALDGLEGSGRASAGNLLHYLALRREDLRDLQVALADLGLSSLGRNESHVLWNLRAVASALRALMGRGGAPPAAPPAVPSLTPSRGRALLEARADALLGPPPEGRRVRIMVTLPTEAAHDEGLVESLISAGMSVARVNTAHDSPDHWERMAALVRACARARGVECRVLFDLAGPKLRTGPFRSGPEVLRVRPTRDALGRVIEPAEVVLCPVGPAPPPPGAGRVPVPSDWLREAAPGDTVELRDSRGRRRRWRVTRRNADGSVVAVSDRTTYVTTGTTLELVRGAGVAGRCEVRHLGAAPERARVRVGDRVILSLRETVGSAAGPAGQPAVVTCTLPEALALVREGDHVWFDDGKVGTVVRSVSEGRIGLEVTAAAAGGENIGGDKGINLPDSDVPVSGLTPEDIGVLPLVARDADLVGMSFVRSPRDVADLRARLDALGGEGVGTVLKIETRRAFENLPALLLAALRGPGAGVMIARGDLAVECGFERLAEVQEEVLWLCEAAHVPVIWATQVLESLAKTGHVSRAEVTDAAMAERAECVMLNKGPHVLEAVRFLDGVLRRMCEHQEKKRPMLRALNVARRFGAASG